MNWKLLLTSFGAVFLAELGDKTQLATLAFAAGGQSRWAVFLGASSALIATSAIAVIAGEALAHVVSPVLLKRAAGVAFIVIGILALWSSRQGA